MTERYCYSLTELAKKWKCTVDDILHIAAREKLWLSVNLNGYEIDGYDPVPISGWWQLLIPSEIGGFLPNRMEAYFSCFRRPKDNTYRTIKSTDGHRARFLIHRDSIVIMTHEVELYEKGNPSLSIPNNQPLDAKKVATHLPGNTKTTKNTGGRKKSPLREAIECAFDHLLTNGRKDPLQPGNVRQFLIILRELRDESNPNKIDYISERIRGVKISRSGCVVTTEDIFQKTDKYIEIIVKSQKYEQKVISKILSELRNKNSL